MSELTHFNAAGQAHMVDVGAKQDTQRVAIAEGWIHMQAETLARIRQGDHKKGDVLGIARVAGIMAAKKTSELIPLCHPLALTHIDVTAERIENGIRFESAVACAGPTGVEMEALTAVSVAALALYDMIKAVDREAVIDGICLLEKSGGKSGTYRRRRRE